ncbi:MAG TPA: sigma 54-interacting transcriptional regulator [Burkholderiales bacterium]|nr:sigma 54-interacting transcriptional regulator [Burkholderiales bacterium]
MRSPTSPEDRNAQLRRVVEAVESETGHAFFRSLARGLAEALGVAYAFVSELTRDGTHFRSLALWARGRDGAPFEVPLAGTPCEGVLAGHISHYPDRICELFERDAALQAWNVRSYAGVPMIDSRGTILGHFAVFDDEPMDEERAAAATDVMRIFAARAAAEVERLRTLDTLHQSQMRLERLVESASDGILSYGADGTIVLFNRAAERILRCKAEDALGTNVSRFGTEEGLRLAGESIEKLAADPEALIFTGGDEGVPARRADGSVFLHEASLSRSDVGGQVLYTIIFRDTEERRRIGREVVELRRENDYLREELGWTYNVDEIVGRSGPVRQVLEHVERVSPTDSTVLLRGETGTGKELIARAIHARSRRKERPLVKVNCAALSPGLVEAELFGHEKGAFTGAGERRIGRFELAHGGTIFLDEVGEIPLDVQVKLLRVLQERELERLGSTHTTQVDVRTIAATNRDLEEEVRRGTFRADLFYRLNIFPIRVPPLRERKQDVPPLAIHFLTAFARRMGKPVEKIGSTAMTRLTAYGWPGNVRELANVLERAVILCQGDTVLEDHLGALADGTRGAGHFLTLEQMERQHIVRALEQTGGVLAGPRGAARLLGMSRSTVWSRMRKLGVQPKS